MNQSYLLVQILASIWLFTDISDSIHVLPVDLCMQLLLPLIVQIHSACSGGIEVTDLIPGIALPHTGLLMAWRLKTSWDILVPVSG